MKKLFKLVLFVFFIGFYTPVFALQHITGEIIPVGESATVDTEMFAYKDFSYTPTVNEKDYGRVTFESVTNKTSKKVPVSIDLLLFNSERKNIAFV